MQVYIHLAIGVWIAHGRFHIERNREFVATQIGTQWCNHNMGIVWVAVCIIQKKIQLDVGGIGRHRRVLESGVFDFELHMGGGHAQIVHDAFHGEYQSHGAVGFYIGKVFGVAAGDHAQERFEIAVGCAHIDVHVHIGFAHFYPAFGFQW